MTGRSPHTARFLLLLMTFASAGCACAGETPAYDGDVDQVIARIPLEQAPIASVALARLNIALHQAKKQAADQLCEGRWLPEGDIVREFGPAPVALAGGGRAWLYDVSRAPATLACGQTSRAQFFQAMSRYLPDWVTVRPAGQTTAYTQGEIRQQAYRDTASR